MKTIFKYLLLFVSLTITSLFCKQPTPDALKTAFIAILDENYIGLQEYIKDGYDVNAQPDIFLTEKHKFFNLFDMSSIVDNKGLYFFIEQIDFLNALLGERNTLLHTAVDLGHSKFVELLLNNNANPRVQNIYKQTTLHFAVERLNNKLLENKMRIIKLLLEKGADINAEDQNGLTVLDYCCEKNHNEDCYYTVCKLLLEKGANAHKKGPHNITALDRARDAGNTKIAKLLSQHMKKTK
ncbi:MAG: ankyrin repeat domain-containing protein [Epsilonproteobacteria bacterium]|nr:ankyrin repeat domain-containing protein [Campylobacterota bacterium]